MVRVEHFGMDSRKNTLVDRFGSGASDLEVHKDAPPVHHLLAGRGSVRRFRPDNIPEQHLRRLCALALCAPTKSDLQQRDIVIIKAPSLRAEIGALLATGPLGQKWIESVPNLLIFCGNNRRQRQVHALRGRHFANDHLDAFFNAASRCGDSPLRLRHRSGGRRPRRLSNQRRAITPTRCPDC